MQPIQPLNLNFNPHKMSGLIIFPILLVICLLPGVGLYSFVGAGDVGVVTRFGAVNRVVNPGLAIKIPVVETTHVMETRTQKTQADSDAASKDLQSVKSTIALNYHLRGSQAVSVYQNIGEDYAERIIDPAMQEIFRATTAQFTAEELIVKRDQVRTVAYNALKDKLDKYDIVVDDFNIVHFDFSQDFNNAIEQKQVSQQNLEKAKIDAQTAVTASQGQADAQKILKDTGSLSPEYLQFLALQKWDGVLPQATAGTPFINIK